MLLPTGRVFDNDRHGGTHVASPRRTGTSHSARAVPRRSWRAQFYTTGATMFIHFMHFYSHHRRGPSLVSFPVSGRQYYLEIIWDKFLLGMIHGDIFTNIFADATVLHFFRRAFPSCIPVQQPSLAAFLHLSSRRPTSGARGGDH